MSDGPDVRPAKSEEQALRTRYDVVRKKLVPGFLERHRLTVVALAELIEVDRSSLNRFLNGIEGYTPTPKRKNKLEMLEKLEALCSRMSIRTHVEGALNYGDMSGRAEGDYDVWFRNFTERINALGEKYDSVTSLVMVPEFRAQAMAAPAPYGTSMCANLLLVITGVLDPRGIQGASPTLLRETIARVELLERFALDNASEEYLRTRSHKPIGYAGFALAALALQVNDDELLDQAMDRLVKAAFSYHEVTDGHWLNLLQILEVLFEIGHSRAARHSFQVARTAEEGSSAMLRTAHSMLSSPRVWDHWDEVAPSLMKSLRTSADEAGR